MVVPVVTMDYNGRPLEVLHELLEKRQKLLRETVKDSIVATAITVLKSIRARTKRYKGKIRISGGKA